MSSNHSPIQEFYRNKSVFITGATGFLGKTLIEKLLRSCNQLDKIYILIRHKKGKTPSERLNDLLNCQLYEIVKKTHPNIVDKLHAIEGDLMHSDLGISGQDRDLLIENVNIVFHSAATVRFDEPLKVAAQMNLIGTKRVIDLCKDLKHLKAFVHVSTAYANCDRTSIGEEVYKPPIEPHKLIEMLDLIDDNLANYISPIIIKPKPNTYTYTKALAESLIVQECSIGNGHGPIPTCIVRPSIITASWREPFPGWIDNFNGPTALFPATGTGVLRSMLGYNNSIADIIPVDISTNLIISAAWHTATKFNPVGTSLKDKSQIMVYNCTSGQINKFTWGMLEEIGAECVMNSPFENVIILPNPRFTSSRMVKFVRTLFEQLVPAYIMDFFLKLFRRKPLFVRLQHKIKKAVEVLEYFTTKEWSFSNDNLYMLMKELNEFDSQTFNFDIRPMNWRPYIEQYWLGTKVYLMKEDISRINYCRRKIKKMRRIYRLAIYSLTAIAIRFVLLKSTSFKQFLTFLLGFGLKFIKNVLKYLEL